ncbi:hypothetical protein IFM89_001540 [Coptis chinensis]|uniref:F-box domain-containing protein n=1 Tax=Coptis chinensis TaxID=261450 RepID=A0A835HBX2_9MAGN|nr:hypothetical protein IFM89_001540 [Coptis chinensis]
MKGSSSLPSVQFLLRKIYKLFSRSTRVQGPDLPKEIIYNILSRLPAECLVRCARDTQLRGITTSPSFVEMHLRRATPIIAFNHDHSVCELHVKFIDKTAKKITKRNYCLDGFYGSYNGFLLFRSPKVLYMCNPIT